MILNVSYSPSDWEHGQLKSHKKFQLNISKFHEDIVKFRFSELMLFSGLKFTVKAVSIKSHVSSRQREGQIKLHQKFELDTLKNGRDMAHFPPESTMYTLLTISLYSVWTKWRHYTMSMQEII